MSRCMRETVSVVIPTRDRPDQLRRAVSAALCQRGVELEVVVVDDGSQPPASPVEDPRIRVIRVEESAGVASARNRGIAAATGAWVAFLDDDDIWSPDRLSRQLDCASATDAHAVVCGTVVLDARGRALQLDPLPDVERLAQQLRGMNVLGGPSAVMVRRDLLRRVGGFDETYSVLADWELYLRLVDAEPFALIPEILNGYVIHAAGMHVMETDRAIAEFERLERVHGCTRVENTPGMYSKHFLRWAGSAHRRAGRRRAAAALYLRNWRRHGEHADLLRALVIFLGEPVMKRLSRSRIDGPLERPSWVTLYLDPRDPDGELRALGPGVTGIAAAEAE